MQYLELPSAAVLAADFPPSGRAPGSGEPRPAPELFARLAAETAASSSGELSKVLGDNLVLRFAEPADAVKAAFRLVAAAAQAGAGRPRIGLALGQARLVDGELLGPTLDGASLLKVLAEPGTVIATGELVHACLTSGLFSSTPLPASRLAGLPPGMRGFVLGPVPDSPAEHRPEPAKAGNDRPVPEGLVQEIRKAILEDTKNAGRRLTVAEARQKYDWYGPEAAEVIASLAEAGILLRSRPAAAGADPSAERAGPDRSYAEGRAGDIGRNIENAVHAIVSEIERSVVESSRRGTRSFDREEFRAAMRRGKEELKAELKLAKLDRRADRRARKRGERRTPAASGFEAYRTELQAKARKLRAGLIPSVLSFAAVSSGLWYFFARGPQPFPWAALVTIFWGAGVLESFLGAIRASRHAAEAEALPELDDQATGELKALNKERDSIGKHFVNALSIPAALSLLAPLFWQGQSWPLILSAVLVGSFLVHLVGYLAKVPGKLRRFFAAAGLPRGRKAQAEARKRNRSQPEDLGAYTEDYREAKASAAAIASSLGAEDPSSLAELKPQLDAYLDQVLLLAKTANELDAIIGEIPMTDLASDKAELLSKAAAAGEGLKSQYLGSIAEIEKQEESFKALQEQREVIDLRLKSSVNQLGQLKLDLARARAAGREDEAARGESAISSIRERSLELSRYIEDLRTGRLEAIVDPFAELEKNYGAELPRPALPSGSGGPAEPKRSQP